MEAKNERSHEELVAENEALRAENDQLRQRISALEADLAHTEDQRTKLYESLTQQSYFHNAVMAAHSGHPVE